MLPGSQQRGRSFKGWEWLAGTDNRTWQALKGSGCDSRNGTVLLGKTEEKGKGKEGKARQYSFIYLLNKILKGWFDTWIICHFLRIEINKQSNTSKISLHLCMEHFQEQIYASYLLRFRIYILGRYVIPYQTFFQAL